MKKNKNMIILVASLIFSVAALLYFFGGLFYSNGYACAKNEYQTIVEEKDDIIDFLVKESGSFNNNYYYAEASIVNQEQVLNGDYCISWEIPDGVDGVYNIFLSYSNEKMNEDAIYLLTMDTKKTDTIIDDEIVVIWTTVE